MPEADNNYAPSKAEVKNAEPSVSGPGPMPWQVRVALVLICLHLAIVAVVDAPAIAHKISSVCRAGLILPIPDVRLTL